MKARGHCLGESWLRCERGRCEGGENWSECDRRCEGGEGITERNSCAVQVLEHAHVYVFGSVRSQCGGSTIKWGLLIVTTPVH